MVKTKKTLVNVKIRTSRQSRQVLQLFGIMLGLGVLFGAVCGLQYWFCKKEFPKRTFMQCMRRWDR